MTECKILSVKTYALRRTKNTFQAWNDFINWSEDEQERLIHGMSSCQPFRDEDDDDFVAGHMDSIHCGQSDDSSTDSWLMVDDSRTGSRLSLTHQPLMNSHSAFCHRNSQVHNWMHPKRRLLCFSSPRL